ncbi:aldo/keto reductase family protein [Actinokineospora enzanensis]|uniref:aldo/keto reductase family protein n=1 Tax=Actinokineospora enzanensis TaxID=155975 RepID=UPI0003607959|nr:aldo/keto reductase family protein [Actinokineospora enzanensis]
MKYTRLGAGGLMVSALAYGNSITARDQLDLDAARGMIDAAVEAGITTFDTADVYADGAAETFLGEALAAHPRENIVLCTKVGRSKKPDPNQGRLSRKHILDSIDGSLRRLGTDYVDLYQAHRYDPDTPVEETVVAFADLVRAGKVRYFGVSEWPAPALREAAKIAAELRTPLVSNQPQYNLLWRVIEGEVIPTSQELGISQIAWSPLAGGILTGKYRAGGDAPEGSRGSLKIGAMSIDRWNYRDPIVLAAVDRLVPLAAEAGLTLPVLALAWVLRNPAVASAIAGASRPEQLAANLAAVDTVLDDDLVKAVEVALAPAVRDNPILTADPLGPAARFH